MFAFLSAVSWVTSIWYDANVSLWHFSVPGDDQNVRLQSIKLKALGGEWMVEWFESESSFGADAREFHVAWSFDRIDDVRSSSLIFADRFGFWFHRESNAGGSAVDLAIPIWLPLVIGAIAPILHVVRERRRRSRASRDRCTMCGYDLHASPDRCPECGTAVG